MEAENELTSKVKSRIDLAKECSIVADSLIKSSQLISAVNRIYFSMYYALVAAALRDGTVLKSDDEALLWLKNQAKEGGKFSERMFEMFQQAHTNRIRVDYEVELELNEGDVNVMFDTMQEFAEVLISYAETGEVVRQIVDIEDEEVAADDEFEVEQMIAEELHNHIVLVPWDFSEVASYALQHAVRFAQKVKGRITLLHIVKKDKEIKPAEDKLAKEAHEAISTYGITTDYIVKVGNIFTEISEVANEIKAKLVVMGTHGVKGMQKITGSYALKVIADTKSPFIVVQSPPEHDEVRNIVFPVDYRREIKQKLNQARMFARLYDAKFHICIPKTINSTLTLQKTTHNLKFVRSFFKANNIDFEVHYVDGTTDFADATLKFSGETKPDLIMILVTKDISIADFILGAEEQRIIANDAKIPVMCVNPLHAKTYTYKTGYA